MAEQRASERNTSIERYTDAKYKKATFTPSKNNKNAVCRIHDGGGLYLQIARAGSKSWVFRFARDGKTHEHGLGSYPEIPLAAARAKARERREMLARGERPLSKREAETQVTAPTPEQWTFKRAALAYIAARKNSTGKRGWTNPKHVSQWENTLTAYVYPFIGDVHVDKITTGQVADLLLPIWTSKVETAARVRMRVKRILDWAGAYGYRNGPNPARWEGALKDVLDEQPDVKEHHAALPYKRLGAFVADLRKQEGIGPLAFEFVLLTVTRANEALMAKWDEINLDDEDGPTWTIPAARMKSRKPHRVPLPPRAVAILKKVALVKDKYNFVFPSPVKEGKPLTSATLLKISKELTGDDSMTTHGTVRSGFTDWAAETTNFPTGVVEAALAHVVADKTRAAYQRGDLFEKRRKLMAAWADYCGTVQKESAKVVPLKKRAKAA